MGHGEAHAWFGITGETLEDRDRCLSLASDRFSYGIVLVGRQSNENLDRHRLVMDDPFLHVRVLANDLPPNLERSFVVRSAPVLLPELAGPQADEFVSGLDHGSNRMTRTSR